MKVLGITGSLRVDSLNTYLLKNVEAHLPTDTTFELLPIDDVPFYNEDLDNDNKPATVITLIEAIEQADALIFATPEYNHSIPGVLKNAIDWASRPAFQSSMKNKPCAILAASMSPVGGARAQADLKNVLSSTLSEVYPSVEYLLPNAHEKMSATGELVDEQAARRLKHYVSGFIEWAQRTV